MQEKVLRLTKVINTPCESIWERWTDISFWPKVWKPHLKSVGITREFKTGAIGQAVVSLLGPVEIAIDTLNVHQRLDLTISQRQEQVLRLTYVTRTHGQDTILTAEMASPSHGWMRLFGRSFKRAFPHHLELLKKELETPDFSFNENLAPAKNTDPYPLPFGFKLWQLSNQWTRQLKQILKRLNLTPSQWLVLDLIVFTTHHQESVTAGWLAQQASLHPVVVSDMVKVLVKKHLVHKLRLSSDKRIFYLRPTPEGKSLARMARQEVVKFESLFFGKLSEQEREIVSQLTALNDIPL